MGSTGEKLRMSPVSVLAEYMLNKTRSKADYFPLYTEKQEKKRPFKKTWEKSCLLINIFFNP